MIRRCPRSRTTCVSPRAYHLSLAMGRPRSFSLLALLFGFYTVGCASGALIFARRAPALATSAAVFALIAAATAQAFWSSRSSVPGWLLAAGAGGLLVFATLGAHLETQLPAAQAPEVRLIAASNAGLWLLLTGLAAWWARRRLARGLT